MTPDSCAAATHCNTLQHTATHCRAIFTTTPGREISVMTPDSCAAASNVRSSCSKFLKSQLNNLSIAKSAVMVILRCSLDLAGGKSCAYCRHCNTCVKHDLQTTVTHVWNMPQHMCETHMWNTYVKHICETHMWNTCVKHDLQTTVTHVWNMPKHICVKHMCETHVWNTYVKHMCFTWHVWNKPQHMCETHVWNTSVKHICETHMWNTCVKHDMCETSPNTCVKHICETHVWNTYVSHDMCETCPNTYVKHICEKWHVWNKPPETSWSCAAVKTCVKTCPLFMCENVRSSCSHILKSQLDRHSILQLVAKCHSENSSHNPCFLRRCKQCAQQLETILKSQFHSHFAQCNESELTFALTMHNINWEYTQNTLCTLKIAPDTLHYTDCIADVCII